MTPSQGTGTSDRYFSFPQPPQFWSTNQNRDRNAFIHNLRDSFFESSELATIDPQFVAGWRVGIVSGYPPPHIFFSRLPADGPAGAGYLLHVGDLWLRDSAFIATLTELVDSELASKSIEERIATVTAKFLEALLSDDFLQDELGKHPRQEKGTAWSSATVREVILDDTAALVRQMRLGKFGTHCPLSQERLTEKHKDATDSSRKRIGGDTRKTRLSNPHEDLAIRLLQPPFAAERKGKNRTYFASGPDSASRDEEAARTRVWLGVEFLLMKLLQGIPQVGGYGAEVLAKGKSWAGQLKKDYAPKSLEEAVLRTVEAVLFPASTAPHAAFVPLLPEHATRKGQQVTVGYVYSVWDQAHLGEDVSDKVKEALAREACRLRDGFRRWLVRGYAVAAGLAATEAEFERSVDTLCRCLVGEDTEREPPGPRASQSANLINPRLEIDPKGYWLDLIESGNRVARFSFKDGLRLAQNHVEELSFAFGIASALQAARSDALDKDRTRTMAVVYKIGHPFKHRAINVANAAADFWTRFGELVEVARERPETTLGDVVHDLDDVHELADLTGKYAIASRAYGEMVNLLSAVIEREGIKGLYEKPDEWLQESEVNLEACLSYAFQHARNKLIGRIKAIPAYKVEPSHLKIIPWLPSPTEGGPPRAPAELIYREIFLELVSNAANHGYERADLVEVEVLIEGDESGVVITLRNRVAENPQRKIDVIDEFQRQTAIGPSGAALVAHLLQQMGLGELAKRCRGAKGDAARYWEYRLKLTGLRIVAG